MKQQQLEDLDKIILENFEKQMQDYRQEKKLLESKIRRLKITIATYEDVVKTQNQQQHEGE